MEKLSLKVSIQGILREECDGPEIFQDGKISETYIKHHFSGAFRHSKKLSQ